MKMVCSICLSPVREEATVLRCGHGFHATCILTWLRYRITCPLCRRPVAVVPDLAASRQIALDAFGLMIVLIVCLNMYIILLLYLCWVLERRAVSVRYVLNDEQQWILLEKIR